MVFSKFLNERHLTADIKVIFVTDVQQKMLKKSSEIFSGFDQDQVKEDALDVNFTPF